jgi:hypothetical protein
MLIFNLFNKIYADVAFKKQYTFQDPCTSIHEALIKLYDDLIFFLVFIAFFIFLCLFILVINDRLNNSNRLLIEPQGHSLFLVFAQKISKTHYLFINVLKYFFSFILGFYLFNLNCLVAFCDVGKKIIPDYKAIFYNPVKIKVILPKPLKPGFENNFVLHGGSDFINYWLKFKNKKILT